MYLFRHETYRIIFNLAFYLVITIYFALALQYPDVFLAQDFSSFIGMILLGFALIYIRAKVLSVFPQPKKERRKLKMTANQLREKMMADRLKRIKSPAIVVGPPPSIAGPSPDGEVMQFDETGRSIIGPDEGGGIRQPDGSVVFPDGSIKYPDGSIRYSDGRLVKADGTVIYPDGRIDAPTSAETSNNDKGKDSDVIPEGEVELDAGQSLEDIKAKLKPKKPKIDVSMLDNSSSYDDKVVLMRMLVSEDSGKVAQVFKKMISS